MQSNITSNTNKKKEEIFKSNENDTSLDKTNTSLDTNSFPNITSTNQTKSPLNNKKQTTTNTNNNNTSTTIDNFHDDSFELTKENLNDIDKSVDQTINKNYSDDDEQKHKKLKIEFHILLKKSIAKLRRAQSTKHQEINNTQATINNYQTKLATAKTELLSIQKDIENEEKKLKEFFG